VCADADKVCARQGGPVDQSAAHSKELRVRCAFPTADGLWKPNCLASRFVDEVPAEHVKRLTERAAVDDWIGAGGSHARARSDASSASGTRLTSSSGLAIGGQTFRVGQGVRHPRFGEGTILGLSGMGLDAQAQIHFLDVGTKTLALGVAKLDIIAG
jgi:DNA helicase-2/ATP-dependent DNA helicase PcrA